MNLWLNCTPGCEDGLTVERFLRLLGHRVEDVVRKSGAMTGTAAHQLVISNSQHWLLQTNLFLVSACQPH
jgi:hypothetical protein